MKIKEKVSSNIASYVFKKANSASFWKTEDCGQTVLPDNFKTTKLAENPKI